MIFSAYKNRKAGLVARSSSTTVTNSAFADNLVGIWMYRNHLNGYSMAKDCCFVGESDNKGKNRQGSISFGTIQIWNNSDHDKIGNCYTPSRLSLLIRIGNLLVELESCEALESVKLSK